MSYKAVANILCVRPLLRSNNAPEKISYECRACLNEVSDFNAISYDPSVLVHVTFLDRGIFSAEMLFPNFTLVLGSMRCPKNSIELYLIIPKADFRFLEETLSICHLEQNPYLNMR